jgi:prepilin-type N-terminal cleavage/methylation domain-containing protein
LHEYTDDVEKLLPMKLFKSQKGFTLIELLVVIGILAVLLAITLIAINPARQFSQANDTKRSSDVNAILNAVNQYMADHQGSLPASLSACTTTPCPLTNDPAVTPKVDICAALVSGYLAAFPVDPLVDSGKAVTEANCSVTDPAYHTGYTISQSTSNNRVTVSATPEISTNVISVTR